MKKVITILLLLVSIIVKSQDDKDLIDLMKIPRDKSGEIIYTDVVNIDSATAQNLYSRAKLFVADVYKSSKDVTQLNDDVAKTILIKPNIKNHIKSFLVNDNWGYTSYQIFIECKDNKYRYTISGFYHHAPSSINNYLRDGGILYKNSPKGYSDKIWAQITLQAKNEIDVIIDLMQKFMKKPILDF